MMTFSTYLSLCILLLGQEQQVATFIIVKQPQCDQLLCSADLSILDARNARASSIPL